MSVLITTPAATGTPLVTAAHGRVLLAGDESSISEIRMLIESIDAVQTKTRRTRGQVFIEVATADDIEVMTTPELITVSWLTRDTRAGRPGTGEACSRGQALDRAVRSWVSEMTTGDTEFDGGEVTAVVLGSGEIVSDLRLDLMNALR